MRKKFSPKSIGALPPATGKRYEVRDELVPGLQIRVSSTGGKVWYVSARFTDSEPIAVTVDRDLWIMQISSDDHEFVFARGGAVIAFPFED